MLYFSEKLDGAINMFRCLSQLNMVNVQQAVRPWIEVILTTE